MTFIRSPMILSAGCHALWLALMGFMMTQEEKIIPPEENKIMVRTLSKHQVQKEFKKISPAKPQLIRENRQIVKRKLRSQILPVNSVPASNFSGQTIFRRNISVKRVTHESKLLKPVLNNHSFPVENRISRKDFSRAPVFHGAPKIIEEENNIRNTANLLRNLIAEIRSAVEASKKYPEFARRAGLEGNVWVKFTLLKSGEIENLKITRKCPYDSLNHEALATVRRVAPFRRLPDEIGKQFLEIELPFSFQIN